MSTADPTSTAMEPLLSPGAADSRMSGHPPAYSPTDPSPRASAPPIDATFTGIPAPEYCYPPLPGVCQQQQPLLPPNPAAAAQPQKSPYPYIPSTAGQPNMEAGQTRIIYIQQPPVTAQQPASQMSFLWHIVLACFVTWCCCWPIGLIAFVLAMCAKSYAGGRDSKAAQQLGLASMGVSISGIVVGIIIVILVAVLNY